MSNLQDNICKLRDVFSNNDFKKLYFMNGIMNQVFSDIHHNIVRKKKDAKYGLDFTAQDLRELADDLRTFIHTLDRSMIADKYIKQVWNESKIVNGIRQIDLKSIQDKTMEKVEFRRDMYPKLYALLNLLDCHSLYLYYLEIYTNDEFAMKYTERVVK